MASTRNHSTIPRCTAGSESRRASRRGGKSGALESAPPPQLASTKFQPDQKTVGQHDHLRVTMETLPDSTLMLIPSQLAFRFFMILFHPIAPVFVLDHHLKSSARREITPVIMMLACRRAARTFANQESRTPIPRPIHAPTSQQAEFRFEFLAVAIAPTNHSPLGQPGDQLFGSTRAITLPAPDSDLKIFAYRCQISLAAAFQAIEKMRIVAVIAIGHHAFRAHAHCPRLVEQIERDFSFGLKSNLCRHVRTPAARRMIRPGLRQIEPGGDRPGQSPLGIMAIDRQLTIANLARRAAVLPLDADRSVSFLEKSGIVKDQSRVAFA